MQVSFAADSRALWRLSWRRAVLFALLATQSFTGAAGDLPRAARVPRTVDLYRDSYGLPHVYAEREEDGFYGVGYATGQDRLLSVLTWYVAVRGELAQTFGPVTPDIGTPPPSNLPAQRSFLSDAVQNDILTRRYRILESARHNLTQLPLQYQKNLQSYILGLGAYMREHPEKTPAWAPRLEPALPLAVLDRLVLEQRGVCSARRRADAGTANSEDAVPSKRGATLAASNAWVIGGQKTSDHRVIFESDSHGPIEAYASAFYPFRLKAGGLDSYAVTIVGSTTFLFGHSPYFAWGYTEGPRDVADCYRVQVDPTAPTTYRFDGQKRKMLTRPYTIKVRGQAPVKGVFEYTQHNGVTSPVEEREGNIAYVVSYASSDRVGLSGLVYYLMAQARDRPHLEAALGRMDAYPANLLIGGSDGTYMYIRPGRIPIRPANIDIRRTLDGNTSATAWKGIHTYEQALKLINPDQGYVGNTNVSPDMMYPASPLQPGAYPPYFGFQPGDTNSRQLRLIELLDHATNVTVPAAQSIAMDEMVPTVRPWPRIFTALLATDALAGGPRELHEFVEELAHFDGVLSKDSRAAIYMATLTATLAEKHGADMTAIAEADAKGIPLTPDQRSILVQAAGEARAQLVTLYGRADVTWGDVHRIGRGGVDLPVGGGNIGVGVASSGASLRALQFSVDPATHIGHMIGGQRVPFVVHFGPSGAESYVQSLWGVSDEPDSPHYSDQAALASERLLRPLPLSVGALEAEHATKTILTIKTRGTHAP